MRVLARLKEKYMVRKRVKEYLLPLYEDINQQRMRSKRCFFELLKMADNDNKKKIIENALLERKSTVQEMLHSFNPLVEPEILVYKDKVGRSSIRITKFGMAASFLSGFVLPTSVLKMAVGGLIVRLHYLLQSLKKEYEGLILPKHLRKTLSDVVNGATNEILGYLWMPRKIFDYLDMSKLEQQATENGAENGNEVCVEPGVQEQKEPENAQEQNGQEDPDLRE